MTWNRFRRFALLALGLFVVCAGLFAACRKSGRDAASPTAQHRPPAPPQPKAAGPLAPPPPWTPVVVSESGRKITVWGRQYDLGNGPLPSMITSAGGPVLSGPIRLQLDDGAIKWGAPVVQTASPTSVELAAKGQSTAVDWGAKVKIHYDGLVWFTLTATPASGAHTITSASLEIPMPGAATRFYSHQLVATAAIGKDWRQRFTDDSNGLWDAGATPAQGWSGEFTPQLWLGNYSRGLAFIAESPEAWSVESDQAIMHVLPVKDQVGGMRIDLIAKPLRLEKARQFEFGLMPNPVRAPGTNRDATRIVDTGGGKLAVQMRNYAPPRFEDSKLNQIARNGAKVVLLWNSWSDLWGFPEITDPQYQTFVHRFVDYAHRLNLKVIVYIAALRQMPNNTREFKTVAPRFLVSKRTFVANKFLVGAGNFRVVPTRGFDDWYIGKLKTLTSTYKIDGVYLDTFARPDMPLETGKVAYGLKGWREFYEGIYRVFHGGVINNGIVAMHDSEPNIFMFNAFADCRLSGEMQYYAQAAHHRYLPDIRNLRERRPLARFFAWTSALPLGDIPTYSLTKVPSTTRFSMGAGFFRTVRADEMVQPFEFFSLGGLFNIYPLVVPPSANRKKSWYYDQTVQFWKFNDQMEDAGAKWISIQAIRQYIDLNAPDSDDIAAAAYLLVGRKMMVQVTNLDDSARDVEVRLRGSTGLADHSLAIAGQLSDAQSDATAPDGKISVHLGPNGYARFIVVTAGAAH